jgi:hypothetical protein
MQSMRAVDETWVELVKYAASMPRRRRRLAKRNRLRWSTHQGRQVNGRDGERSRVRGAVPNEVPAGNPEQEESIMPEHTGDTDKTTSPGEKKPATPDALVKGGKAELTEDQLKDVAGGFAPADGVIKQ